MKNSEKFQMYDYGSAEANQQHYNIVSRRLTVTIDNPLCCYYCKSNL